MQSIPKLRAKINRLRRRIKRIDERVLLIGILVLSSTLAFALGRLSALDHAASDIMIEEREFDALPASAYATRQEGREERASEGSVVASKNSDKYHLPWCSGAQRIKEENKIFFSSPEEARAAGYSAAKNCPGLE